ncbi:hypothetical protein HHK36_003098 [Tetracentron sinense]|uniref:HMA domain-containing protein n=1 Tax=Tetracentron sinense TaxID=13715 RepID=A0A835DS56_TETSI|nr:hypothetical protein HHK36_003098 [Tetracentron sinense]
MKLIAGIEGITSIVLDPSKNTVTVIGEADPVKIIKRVRCFRKHAKIESIGPPPKDEKKDEKKDIHPTHPMTCHKCDVWRSSSMVQRTVLKVDISCQKCKKKLLRAVSGLEGVDKIEVDVAKSTLTVTGDADPYEVIVRTRKTGKVSEVMSVGPPPPPPKPDAAKKPDDKKPEQKALIHIPQTCAVCERMSIRRLDEPNVSCSIM